MATTATKPAEQTISNPLEVVSVKEFMAANNFISVHGKVRKNTSGYPYITFINANNEAENIYFSKGAADLPNAEEGTDIVKGFFDNLQIAETVNADGEVRIKLVRVGDGTRTTVADLF